MTHPLDGSDRDFWVFGYGSLMWRPGFDYLERTGATVRGYHRALCIRSFVHRGTPDHPGLVLGLDRGGSCRGVAFRVAPEQALATLAYLREREQVTSVYVEIEPTARLADGREVAVLAYRADRRHTQYARPGTLSEQLETIRVSHGNSGANRDYVLATRDHLEEMGIRDSALDWLSGQLRADPGA